MRRADQSVDKQIAALEHFHRKGELHKIAFAVEMDLPRNYRGTDGKRYAAAEYPAGWIPYIPVVEEWFVSLALAEMLADLFARDNEGKKIDFYPALFSPEELVGDPDYPNKIYVYGHPTVDRICERCGAISAIPIDSEEDTDYFHCENCGKTNWKY